jgi:hypothetical protein
MGLVVHGALFCVFAVVLALLIWYFNDRAPDSLLSWIVYIILPLLLGLGCILGMTFTGFKLIMGAL